VRAEIHLKTPSARPPNPRIDITLLQTFHLVVKQGSFSAAARVLNLSYQSVANQIRRLEQLYGTPLVLTDRGARRVALSPQGKALHATLSIELDNILSRIALLLHDQRSVLRVGVPQALFHTFFPQVLTAFKDHAPSMRLAFLERDTTLERMMLDGELDAAVSERFFDQETITQQALGDYHLSLIYPRAWQAAGEAELKLEAFATREMITYETGQTVRVRAVDHLTHVFGHPPLIGVTASGSTSIVQLVMAGLGYAVVPRWMVPTSHAAIAQLVLRQIKPMRVYFASTTLLASNAFVQQLHRTCSDVIGPAMDHPAGATPP